MQINFNGNQLSIMTFLLPFQFLVLFAPRVEHSVEVTNIVHS